MGIDKSALVEKLSEEVKSIKIAMRDIGYYAHKTTFLSSGKYAPTVQIEARPWEEGDQELIDNNS